MAAPVLRTAVATLVPVPRAIKESTAQVIKFQMLSDFYDLWAKIKSEQTLKKSPQPRLAGHVNQSKFKVEKRIELKLLEY